MYIGTLLQSEGCDHGYFHIYKFRQRRHLYTFTGRRIFREVPGIHLIYLGKLVHVGEKNTAFDHVRKIQPGFPENSTQVFHHLFGSVLYPRIYQLPRSSIHRDLAGYKQEITGTDRLVVRPYGRGSAVSIDDLFFHGANVILLHSHFPAMPYLLYLDTAASVATAALSHDGRLLAIRTHSDAREQAALLPGMIETVVSEAGIRLPEIDAYCVCAGPGSYTGLRVSLSTAKGLAYALDKPLMLFNRLDLIALAQNEPGDLALALKARAGEYFYAEYRPDKTTLLAPQHMFAETLAQNIRPGLKFITDDAAFPFEVPATLLAAEEAVDVPAWIPVAEQRFSAGSFDDLAYAEPFYLKAAYTTQPKK